MRDIRIRTLIGAAATAILAVIVVSCGGGGGDSTPAPTPTPTPTPTPSPIVIRSATLTGGAEVPPITTGGSGRGAVIVNTTTMEITGGVTFTGLSGAATDAHIHLGATGVAGGVEIGLTLHPNGSAATIPAGTTITASQLTALQAGNLYFNVHTAMNANGEIRGQVSGTANLIAGLSTLNGANEVPPVTTTATGRGTIVVDSSTRQILIAYVTHNVTNANDAHIHQGAAGVAGGVQIGLTPMSATVAAAAHGATLTTQNVTDLNAGSLYFNIHSVAFGNGEIRGQIGVVQ